MKYNFKEFLRTLLKFLEANEIDEAKAYINNILNDLEKR